MYVGRPLAGKSRKTHAVRSELGFEVTDEQIVGEALCGAKVMVVEDNIPFDEHLNPCKRCCAVTRDQRLTMIREAAAAA